MTKLQYQIVALKMWLAEAPREAHFKRGMDKTGMDSTEVWSYINAERQSFHERISELQEKERAECVDSNVTYITSRKQVSA
jgi:hypothetical protein